MARNPTYPGHWLCFLERLARPSAASVCTAHCAFRGMMGQGLGPPVSTGLCPRKLSRAGVFKANSAEWVLLRSSSVRRQFAGLIFMAFICTPLLWKRKKPRNMLTSCSQNSLRFFSQCVTLRHVGRRRCEYSNAFSWKEYKIYLKFLKVSLIQLFSLLESASGLGGADPHCNSCLWGMHTISTFLFI